jgi:L-rhamnose mutarotase
MLKGHIAMKNITKPTTIVLAATLLTFYLTLNGCAQQKIQRYGSVIGLKPEKIEEYKRLHANVWPDVLKMIKQCNICNYSIYLGELENNKYYLFSYFEYTGDDFDADMAKMAADPTTQKWWTFCEPCQNPIQTRKEGEWWANMEEVFHCE